METMKIDGRLQRTVEKVFSPRLKQDVVSHGDDDRRKEEVFIIPFFGRKMFLYVPEIELEMDVGNFYATDGAIGIVLAQCIMHVEDPSQLDIDFWKIVRDGRYKGLTSMAEPWKVFHKYTFDKDRKKAYVVARFDLKNYVKQEQEIFYPDHVKGLPDAKLGLTYVLLYDPLNI